MGGTFSSDTSSPEAEKYVTSPRPNNPDIQLQENVNSPRPNNNDIPQESKTPPDKPKKSWMSSMSRAVLGSASKEDSQYNYVNDGYTPLVTFYASILSRASYLPVDEFCDFYAKAVYNPLTTDAPITEQMLTCVNGASIGNIVEDETIFKDIQMKSMFKEEVEPKYVDFRGLGIPKKINELFNAYLADKPVEPKRMSESMKCVAISTSNYGIIYIIYDTKMPSWIWVVFRGTYSSKSALSYTKLSSISTTTVGEDYFLGGILKILMDVIHTILESMTYLVKDRLDKTPVKVFTTGHSLGGALATQFAYVWRTRIVDKYPDLPFEKNIVCISLGAPRCLGITTAKKFCKLVMDKKITYVRSVTTGDAVTGMPSKNITYFSHPCSFNDKEREFVAQDCNDTGFLTAVQGYNLSKIRKGEINTPTLYYNKNLKCTKTRKITKETGIIVPTMFRHTKYLDINYLGAISMLGFLFPSSDQTEITRLHVKTPSTSVTSKINDKMGFKQLYNSVDDTVCRVVFVDNGYRSVFFDLNSARQSDKKTGENIFYEDIFISPFVFNELVSNSDKNHEIPTVNFSPTDIIFINKPDPDVKIYSYKPRSLSGEGAKIEVSPQSISVSNKAQQILPGAIVVDTKKPEEIELSELPAVSAETAAPEPAPAPAPAPAPVAPVAPEPEPVEPAEPVVAEPEPVAEPVKTEAPVKIAQKLDFLPSPVGTVSAAAAAGGGSFKNNRLYKEQKARLQAIYDELYKNRRKTTHWIWYVFPTLMPGTNGNVVIDPEYVNHLYNKDKGLYKLWLKILNLMTTLIQEKSRSYVVPQADLGRIGYFFVTVRQFSLPEEFLNAIHNLQKVMNLPKSPSGGHRTRHRTRRHRTRNRRRTHVKK
jgi:hypothetical protein